MKPGLQCPLSCPAQEISSVLVLGMHTPASSWVFSFREALSTTVSLLVASGGAAIPIGWELLFGEAAKRCSSLHRITRVLCWPNRLFIGGNGYSPRWSGRALLKRVRVSVGSRQKASYSLGQNDLDRSPRYFFDSQKRVPKKLPCSAEPYPSEIVVRRNAKFLSEEMTESGW